MSRPRIELICPPFRGHLHPMLAIGRALSDFADVRVLSTPDALEEITASGLEGEAMMTGEDPAIERIANPPYAIRSSPTALARQLRQTLGLLERLSAVMSLRYQRDRPDLVIVDSVLPVVGLAAAQNGARWWTSIASPCAIEPHQGAPGYLGGWTHREDAFGRVRDSVGRGVVKVFKRLVYRLHRNRLRALGLPALYRANGDEAIYSPDRILGLGLPELEFPRKWPRAFRFVGPMLYTPPAPAPPIRLEPERRHILVTFGTHLRWLKDTQAESIARLPSEFPETIFHFSDGRPAQMSPRENRVRPDPMETNGTFRRHPYVPYDRYLESFALVVHHGGAGITYHCIAHGRPCVVLPVDYDQFDYAARIDRAGIGRRIRHLRELPNALKAALADARMSEACQRFQRLLADYDPPAKLRTVVREALGRP